MTSFTTTLSGEAAPRCTLMTQPLYLGRQQTLEWIRNSNAMGERLQILDNIDIINNKSVWSDSNEGFRASALDKYEKILLYRVLPE